MNYKSLFILIIIGIQYNAFSQNTNNHLTQELENLNNNNSIVGFGVAIFTKDSVLYSNGFGYADKELKRLYTTSSVQKVASISKLLLGVSLMKAQEMELLNLDDDVNKYLSFKLINPNYPDDKITIRHLASHTSGLKKLPLFDLKAIYAPTPFPKIDKEIAFGLRKLVLNTLIKSINKNKNINLSEFLFNLYSPDGKWYKKNHFKKKKPGESYIYTNNGASLLALIIEKASGIKYSDFVRKHIISKLGMNNSGFDFEMKDYPKDKKSSLYYAGLHVPNNYNFIMYPAGGLETNINDFIIFMQSIAKAYYSENDILKQSSVKEMIRIQFNSNLTYGILWKIRPNSSVGHRGDIIGATTYTFYNVDKDIGYILFCNIGNSKTINKATDEIIKTLKNYYDELKPKTKSTTNSTYQTIIMKNNLSIFIFSNI